MEEIKIRRGDSLAETDADSHRNYIASLNNLTPVPVPVWLKETRSFSRRRRCRSVLN